MSPKESVTSALKLTVPAVVGVPEMTPAGDNVRPSAENPVHVYGLPLPPEAVSVCEYTVPAMPTGREVGLIIIGG